MDVLSDILDTLEFEGSLYFSTEFSAPYSLEVPADSNVCRFHVVVQGTCTVTVPATGQRRELARGDLALVPHGALHTLQSDTDAPLDPLEKALDEGELSEDGCLSWGGGGAVTRMVCGYFAFDREVVSPLLRELPGLIHVEATSSYDFAWIENVSRFLGQEAGSGRPGSAAISRRLSEVLFIQAIRHHAEGAGPDAPVLAAILDPHLGQALQALHAEPGADWTLASLAREAGLSRSVFADRFRELVRATPMQYLTDLRMQRARTLLRSSQASTPAIAERVGYRSEAAFHRAFARTFGLGPGAYRRNSTAHAARPL